MKKMTNDCFIDCLSRPDAAGSDDDRMYYLKSIVTGRLSPGDRDIILSYAEYGSVRELAKHLGISHTGARKAVSRVRKAVLKEYNRHILGII